MSCIRTRKNKNGTTSYQAIVRIAGQPTLRETFSDKVKARAWGDAMSVAARESVGQMPDVKAFRRVKMIDALKEWGSHQLCPKSYSSVIPTVLRLIGDISLGRINKEYVLSYINYARISKTQFNRLFSDVTILKHLAVLRGAMRFVAEKHRVTADLSIFNVSKVDGKWSVERKRVLSSDEQVLLDAAILTRRYSLPWTLLIDLAIETCARESELVLMEFPEFNMQSRVWTIPAEHTKMGYEREVPLSVKATNIVIQLKNLLDQRNIKLTKDGKTNDELETRLFWRFKTPSAVSTGFAKLIRAAGIIDFHFHDLRHTAITRITLNKRNLEVHEIMRLSGHKTMDMFIRYSNYRAEDLVSRMG